MKVGIYHNIYLYFKSEYFRSSETKLVKLIQIWSTGESIFLHTNNQSGSSLSRIPISFGRVGFSLFFLMGYSFFLVLVLIFYCSWISMCEFQIRRGLNRQEGNSTDQIFFFFLFSAGFYFLGRCFWFWIFFLKDCFLSDQWRSWRCQMVGILLSLRENHHHFLLLGAIPSFYR